MASYHGPAAPAVPKGYAAVDAAALTGDRLGGVPVYGPGGRVIGSVSKVLEDVKGRPRFLVVDVGGFLGFGERPVKLALGAVSIQRQVAGGAAGLQGVNGIGGRVPPATLSRWSGDPALSGRERPAMFGGW